MTTVQRVLFFELMDDKESDPRFPIHLYHLSHFRRCEEIVRWCLKNKLKGMAFLRFVEGPHQGSIISAAGYVLKRIERETSRRPVLAGRDYLC